MPKPTGQARPVEPADRSSIMDPDVPLTRADARLYQRMSRDKAWLKNLSPEKRQRAVDKLLTALDQINPGNSIGARIVTIIVSTLATLDKIDFDREKAGIALELELQKQGAVSAGAMPQVVYITGRPEIPTETVDPQDVVPK